MISLGNNEDVNNAVKSCRETFERGDWSSMPPIERKKILLRIADLIEKNMLELAVLGVRDNGTEINMAFKAEPGSASGTFRYYAEAIDKIYGEIAPTPNNFLGLIGFLLSVWVYYFFRDPERTIIGDDSYIVCLLYTSPSPRDATLSRMRCSA